jgi:hypothetical protein
MNPKRNFENFNDIPKVNNTTGSAKSNIIQSAKSKRSQKEPNRED